MSVTLITENAFKIDVLKSDVPVIVDFFTPNCGPCRSLAPVYEQVSEEHNGIRFIKIDASQAPDVSSEYKVSGVPTIVAFKNGKEVDRQVGFNGKPSLIKFVQALTDEKTQ